MEIRFGSTSLLAVVLSVAVGSSVSLNQAQLGDSEVQEVEKKPQFLSKPEDKYVLPNSTADLYCEAKFVSKLNFSCTGGLVPEEVLQYEDENNVTLLITTVTYNMVMASDPNGAFCVCFATGYNGLVLKSRSALVALAYLNQDFVISPSQKIRVAKNSIATLRCQPPRGLPRPTVSWEKDDKPVEPLADGRIQVTNQANLSFLLIRRAETLDAGQYYCVASSFVAKRKSAMIKLNVYVDGGWSDWYEFSPCSAMKCANGTRLWKRSCSNPAPKHGGQFCSGPSVVVEQCQNICPDLEIICPNHTKLTVNRSDTEPQNVSWSEPKVINRKKGTRVLLEVDPPWAVPPIVFNASKARYVITYVATHEYGQTANCSFNITVLNDSSSAHSTKEPPLIPYGESKEGILAVILIVLSIALVVLLGSAAIWSWRHMKSRQSHSTLCASESEDIPLRRNYLITAGSYKERTLDGTSPVIRCADSYSVLVELSGKLRTGSPTIQEDFHSEPSIKVPEELGATQIPETKALKNNEAATANAQRSNRKDYKRTNSSASSKSTASEISQMMWNITNLPENVDPNMVAWGLVDHNGGKFTIGDTGVCLSVPPQAIPKGHTEGIFIAVVNQEKEHPQLRGKESLLSPVVKCGPNGLKFERPVILSMPHCALLEDGAWDLKVQYNESKPGMPTDWKQLVDINKQDGSEPYLVLLEPNMVHLMVDHFTDFAVTGKSASSQGAKKTVQIVAYVTPPEAGGDCIVRVYCVGDTPVHLETVHHQEIERLGGVTRDAPKPFHFRDGGGDLLVKLTDYHHGWTNTSGDLKRIRFQHIWEGIERMPSCTSVFTLADGRVPQFRANFEIKQDCQDGDEQEVVVSTPVKQRPLTGKSESNNKATEQTCSCTASAHLLKAAESASSLEDATANLLRGAVAVSPAASPLQLNHTSSGYFSFGFEPLPSADSLTQRMRSELIIALDPPHPKADWRTLAEDLGFELKYIRWLESLKPPASPTDTLLTFLEGQQFPLHKLAEKLHNMGRDDAAALLEAQLVLRETEV